MDIFRISSWSAIAVSIIIIIKGLITATSSTGLDLISVIVANILPIILFYAAICILRSKNKDTLLKSSSVLVLIAAFLWIIILIPGLPTLFNVLIIGLNFLISVTALIIINWHIGKTLGLAITIVFLLLVIVFVGAYGRSVLSPSTSEVTSGQVN